MLGKEGKTTQHTKQHNATRPIGSLKKLPQVSCWQDLHTFNLIKQQLGMRTDFARRHDHKWQLVSVLQMREKKKWPLQTCGCSGACACACLYLPMTDSRSNHTMLIGLCLFNGEGLEKISQNFTPLLCV